MTKEELTEITEKIMDRLVYGMPDRTVDRINFVASQLAEFADVVTEVTKQNLAIEAQQ